MSAQDFSRNSAAYSNRKRKMSTGKKVAIGIAVLLLAVLLGAAAAVLLYLSSVNDSLSEGVTQEEQLAIN
ncbi:MAG: hypothetical protein IJC51_05580, partial [Eggerthellaceae bacterium]|nr:hypothetical protein [Eggerthellaceae bacterium]